MGKGVAEGQPMFRKKDYKLLLANHSAVFWQIYLWLAREYLIWVHFLRPAKYNILAPLLAARRPIHE